MHWIDPDYLPRLDGTLDRFLFNPHGDVDGFVMSGAMEVHVPPHLSAELRAAVQPGETVTVFGVRPRNAEMVSAVAIETRTGTRIVDNGPPKNKEKKHKAHRHDTPGVTNAAANGHDEPWQDEPGQNKAGQDGPRGNRPPSPSMEVEGTVQRVLHGPKGEARGALLQDGRIVRLPLHDAKDRGALLQPGAALAARGPGLSVDGAVVIDAKEVGATLGSLEPVKPKPPKGGKHGKPKHGQPHGKDHGGKDREAPHA